MNIAPSALLTISKFSASATAHCGCVISVRPLVVQHLLPFSFIIVHALPIFHATFLNNFRQSCYAEWRHADSWILNVCFEEDFVTSRRRRSHLRLCQNGTTYLLLCNPMRLYWGLPSNWKAHVTITPTSLFLHSSSYSVVKITWRGCCWDIQSGGSILKGVSERMKVAKCVA